MMLPSFFCIFGSGSNLKVIFWENVGHWPASVELLGAFVEEPFHEVEQFVVLFSIDSGIFDDETSVGFQCLSNDFTVLSVVSGFSEESLDIDDGDR